MAKGSRGGKGSTVGKGVKVRLKTVPSRGDTKIHLEEPLEYTEKQQLSDSIRAAIDSWESKRVLNKIEYATVIDAYGNSLGEFKGGKHSVSTPKYIKDRGEVFSHIHPRSGGDGAQLGGTFSTADLRNFSNSPIQNYRAAASEGTYFISKNSNFNASGFKQFALKMEQSERANMNMAINKLNKQYYAGKMSYENTCKAIDNEFNKYLVNMHNKLIGAQSQYGYTYGLERRG